LVWLLKNPAKTKVFFIKESEILHGKSGDTWLSNKKTAGR
jgi:hypothetical protein